MTNKTKKHNHKFKKLSAMAAASFMIISLVLGGCGSAASSQTSASAAQAVETEAPSSDTSAQTAGSESDASTETGARSSEELIEDITGNITETIENSADGEHAITADGEEASYSNIAVVKTGESEGDEADFYGENAAIFATNGAALTLSGISVNTDGKHANGVFSYGEGTTVNISDSVIETSGNCSGGLMTTGGGTMNASNLVIHTTGNSSAAIRSDRGGGTVNVTGGSYTTDGTGSPVIYSTADITVSDASMESTASQGVVVEGKNSVTLNNVNLTADNVSKNSDKSSWYQAVMIYQSMSGDAAEGLASFAMNGGTLTNLNGDVFFVNNTSAAINLSGAEIINEDEEGVFLRAAAAGWGSEGSNGGHVTMTAAQQTINGDMLVDEVSTLNLYLTKNSSFTGAVNPDGTAGDVYVEIEDGSTWTLTGDSYITTLTCGTGSIDLNGFKLYVNGVEYTEGSASEGEAIEVETSSSSSHGGKGGDGKGGSRSGEDGSNGSGDSSNGNKGGGKPPAKPDGEDSGDGSSDTGDSSSDTGDGSHGNKGGGKPPAKPDGEDNGGGSEPPAKPDGEDNV